MSIAPTKPHSDLPGAQSFGRAVAHGTALHPDEKPAEKSLLQVVAFKSSLPNVPACVHLNAWGGAFSALYMVTADEAEEIALQLQAAAGRVRGMNAGLSVRRAA
jgi:hypothetical protein